MRKMNRILLLVACLIGPIAIGSIASAVALPAASDQGRAQTEAVQAFSVVQKVLQHPRCQNCHIPGDAPLQFDQGLVHSQNVRRGTSGMGAKGLACSACHSTRNPPASYGANIPPGAPGWRLPSAQHKMVFIGLSAGELCRHVQDKKENGGMDLKALLEHVSHDKLVLWGWDPGVGRAPVDVPHDKFVAAFRTWTAAGAPCPGP